MATQKAALVDQVKDYQRKGEMQKLAWYDFVAKQGGVKKDPNFYDEHILTEFLGGTGEDISQMGVINAHNAGPVDEANKAGLVAQIKNYQKMSDGHKLAWYCFVQEQGTGKKDPAFYNEDILQLFLTRTETGEIVPKTDSMVADKAVFVERVKMYQSQGEGHKQAWYNFIDEQGTGKRDPSFYDERILEDFLVGTEKGKIVPVDVANSSDMSPAAMMDMMWWMMQNCKGGGKGGWGSTPYGDHGQKGGRGW